MSLSKGRCHSPPAAQTAALAPHRGSVLAPGRTLSLIMMPVARRRARQRLGGRVTVRVCQRASRGPSAESGGRAARPWAFAGARGAPPRSGQQVSISSPEFHSGSKHPGQLGDQTCPEKLSPLSLASTQAWFAAFLVESHRESGRFSFQASTACRHGPRGRFHAICRSSGMLGCRNGRVSVRPAS